MKEKITFTGEIRIQEQEGGHAEPILQVGGVNVASGVEDFLKSLPHLTEEQKDAYDDLVATGRWRITVQRL